jgi:hypothetical protein
MNKFDSLAKNLIILLFIIGYVISVNAQISNDGVFKKYIIKDTLESKHAVLILYSNGFFLNFGLADNKLEKGQHIWFTRGNYLIVPSKIFLRSITETLETDEKTLNSIKKYYDDCKDHAFVTTYHDYQKENYKDFSLQISDDCLIDELRKIIYVEKK